MKATFDFDKKTIKFEGQYKIADVHIIQDLLGADWQEWVVVQEWAWAPPVVSPLVPSPLPSEMYKPL